MKHAVILAHPDPNSYNAALARRYAAAVGDLGHQVVLRDLYALGFDPRLSRRELPSQPDYAVGADVIAERALIADSDVFALVYPLWFMAPPAMMKGYIDRVFGLHFGYEPRGSMSDPKLVGRRLVSITTSGSPDVWLQEIGVLESLTRLFDDTLTSMCGFSLIGHLHFGHVTPGMPEEAAAADFGKIQQLVARAFASAPAE